MSSKIRELKSKSFLGIAFLIGLLWLGLFLSAGSLYFWQGWIYWLIFLVASTVVTIYLIKRDLKLLESRLKPGPTAETEKSQKIIQFFASVFFVSMLIESGLDHRYQWSIVPFSLVVVGNAFVILGFTVIFLVFRENSYASGVIEIDGEQKVVSTGPYSVVRHPMYAGGLLLVFFTPFALGSFWALLFSFALFVVIVFRLLDEEKFLSKNLHGYAEYCANVRYRLIPLIW